MIQKKYRNYKIPKDKTNTFVRNLKSLPKLQRTLDALEWANVDVKELHVHTGKPDLILLQAYEIARFHRISSKANIGTYLSFIKWHLLSSMLLKCETLFLSKWFYTYV